MLDAETFYVKLKAADAALSPAISDPVQAANYFNGQASAVTQDVTAADAREILLVSGEWAAIKQLAATQNAGATAAALCIDTLTLTDTLRVSNGAVWAQVQAQMAALKTAGALSQASIDAITALRNKSQPSWDRTITQYDIVAARSM